MSSKIKLYRFIKPYLAQCHINDMAFGEMIDGAMRITTRFGDYYPVVEYFLEEIELKYGLEFILAYPLNKNYKDKIAMCRSSCLFKDGSMPVFIDNERFNPYAYEFRYILKNIVIEEKVVCTCDIIDLMATGCKCGGR